MTRIMFYSLLSGAAAIANSLATNDGSMTMVVYFLGMVMMLLMDIANMLDDQKKRSPK